MASFVATGGYDETFRQNEDAEFDNRLTARGGRVFLDADIRIGYHPRSGFRGLWRQYFNYGFGRSRTARRHPATIRLRQLLVPAHLCIVVASLLLAVATRQLLFLAWPLLYAAILFRDFAGDGRCQAFDMRLIGGPGGRRDAHGMGHGLLDRTGTHP